MRIKADKANRVARMLDMYAKILGATAKASRVTIAAKSAKMGLIPEGCFQLKILVASIKTIASPVKKANK